MSLDVYLIQPGYQRIGSGIFIRENGQNKEISREEWDQRYPDREPIVVDDITNECYSANITHNLGGMADAAGIYEVLWRAPENGITSAVQLIQPLTVGLMRLTQNPDKFIQLSPANGWGTYDGLVQFVRDLLNACKRNPEAKFETWR